MAKPELGAKRQCRSCGNRFYDLGRDPITCPKCGAVFEVAAVSAKAGSPSVAAAPDRDEAPVLDTPAGPELVSLDEADAGATGKVAEAEEETEEGEPAAEDGTFLEEEEEGDDDVSTLIDGDIEDDEEA